MPKNPSGASRFPRWTLAAWFVLAAALLSAPAAADRSDLPPEVGYNYGEIETPRIAAMGGAQRAFTTGNKSAKRSNGKSFDCDGRLLTPKTTEVDAVRDRPCRGVARL
jgi:hypothetical protein